MSIENFNNEPKNESDEIDFSNEQHQLEMKMHEYRTCGEERGEEWANKIQEMFNDKKKAIIEANRTFDEDRTPFDTAWEEMNDFVREELKLGL